MVINLNNNLDEKTLNNIKNMVNNENLNDVISQISPEMLENFSKMMSKETTKNQNTTNPTNNLDFSNVDMNTLIKLASTINTSNQDDPRNNLLNALKPYMRDSKKDKMNNYINMLNMAKIANLLNNSNNNTQGKK